MIWDSGTVTMISLVWTILLMIGITNVWPWFRAVARIPGNDIIPVFGTFKDPFLKKFDIVKTLSEVAKRHSGLFKVWAGPIPVVVVTDPQYLKTYYTSTHALDRSVIYDVVGEILGQNNLFSSGGQTWKNLRKVITVNFLGTSAEILSTTFVQEAEKLVNTLKGKADGQFFPLNSTLMTTTARAILLNSAAEEVPEEELSEYLTAIHFLMTAFFTRTFSALKRYKMVYRLYPEGRVSQKNIEIVNKFVKKIVQKKQDQFIEMKKNAEAIPNLYVFNIFESHGVNNETLELLLSELKTLIIAGLDTTAGTMGFVLIVLGLFPEVQEKVYQEDQELQRRLQGRQLQAEDLQHYRYLERVIKETLRIFPVAALLGRKLTKDTYFGKHLVPKGMDLWALQTFANHNPEIYPEPLKFDPDRFLPENAAKIPPYAFNPFSNGPKSCPGMRYANMSMKIMLPAVVRQFKVYSKYESLDEALDNVIVELTLKEKQGWPVRLQTRP